MSGKFENDFRESMNALHFSSGEKSEMIHRLEQSMQTEKERENTNMKKWTLPRAAAALAACIMATGVTAFAASKIVSYNSWSNADYDYTAAADMSLGESNAAAPDFPYTIGGGYVFDGGNDVHVSGKDEDGNTAGTWDDLRAIYKNDAGDMINVLMSPKPIDDGGRTATETRKIRDTIVSYNYDEYLFLPPKAEYETLEADIQNRLDTDDHFFVSYGSDEPETRYFSGVIFEKDGISYDIFTYSDVSADELFSMAEEMITR